MKRSVWTVTITSMKLSGSSSNKSTANPPVSLFLCTAGISLCDYICRLFCVLSQSNKMSAYSMYNIILLDTFFMNFVLSAENCLWTFIHFSWNFVLEISAENCLGTFIHFSWNSVLGVSAENCLGTFIHFSWNFVLGSFRRKLFGDFGWLCSTTSHFTPVIDILKGLPPPSKKWCMKKHAS